MKKWDLILVGAGLANGLIAWRLKQRHPTLAVLMLECGDAPGGNHTWSFHQHDITPAQHAWLAPLVAHRWDGYDVHFPDVSRTLHDGYLTITSTRFAQAMRGLMKENLLTNVTVSRVSGQEVALSDGRRFTAGAVIDGRGYQPSPHLSIGYQAFIGQEWQLAAPHGLTRPILMDARVAQGNGYRFVYTLPLSADTLLIEDTHYIDGPTLDADSARARIADYARQQGWQLARLVREEQGALPITLSGDPAAFWHQLHHQPVSGLRAGLFHATTGYSLPLAVRLADRIANAPGLHQGALYQLIADFAAHHWQTQRFFRLLNRMLFLAGTPDQRWRVMQRFYQLDEQLIARFYAGQLRSADRARLLLGKPPVPIVGAIKALLHTHSSLRAHHK